jgi:hypothetical protein
VTVAVSRGQTGYEDHVADHRRDPDRLRRRQQLLERRAMTRDWRHRLLARRLKYVQGHRDLARRLSAME